jgi:hypothetical protein
VLQLGPHPWIDDLRLTFGGGKRFLALALVSGPAFGGPGGWWAKARSIVVPLGLAVLFVVEPVGALVTQSTGSVVVWAGEITFGIVAVLLVVWLAPRGFVSGSEGVLGAVVE